MFKMCKERIKMIINIIAVLLLSALAIVDCRKRSLPVGILVLLVILSGVAGFISGVEYGIFEIIAIIVLTGGMCFARIGKADIVIVLSICLLKGFWDGIVIVWLGFLLCGFFGLGLMLGKKATRLTWLPLVPFLNLAYTIFWLWRLV